MTIAPPSLLTARLPRPLGSPVASRARSRPPCAPFRPSARSARTTEDQEGSFPQYPGGGSQSAVRWRSRAGSSAWMNTGAGVASPSAYSEQGDVTRALRGVHFSHVGMHSGGSRVARRLARRPEPKSKAGTWGNIISAPSDLERLEEPLRPRWGVRRETRHSGKMDCNASRGPGRNRGDQRGEVGTSSLLPRSTCFPLSFYYSLYVFLLLIVHQLKSTFT